MKTERKSELKGAFKAIVAIAILGLMIGIGVATVLITDEGVYVNNNEVLVEQDYTTWTYKWNTTLPGGMWDPSTTVFQIDDKNDVLSVLYHDSSNYNRFGTFNLADNSTIFNSTSGVEYSPAGSTPELNYMSGGDNSYIYNNIDVSSRSYLLLLRDGNMVIEVWRAGSLVWNHNTTSEGVTGVYSGGVSNTGKWIVVGVYIGGNANLICYEGS